MSEVNRKKKIGVGTWIALVLALILIVEAGIVVFHCAHAKMQAGLVSVTHEHKTPLTKGVVLYDVDPDFKVDHNFLLKLMKLSEQDINTVRLAIDVSNNFISDGSQVMLNGEWLRQIASLSEMIFQSEYRLQLCLEVPENLKLTPVSYESMWKQINEAFGHRPADELWFELSIDEDHTSASWNSAIIEIIKAMRLSCADREIVLILGENADSNVLSLASDLCKEYKLHPAAFARKDMNPAVLEQMSKIDFQNDVGAILIEPQDAEDNYTETIALEKSFGYLLQGD